MWPHGSQEAAKPGVWDPQCTGLSALTDPAQAMVSITVAASFQGPLAPSCIPPSHTCAHWGPLGSRARMTLFLELLAVLRVLSSWIVCGRCRLCWEDSCPGQAGLQPVSQGVGSRGTRAQSKGRTVGLGACTPGGCASSLQPGGRHTAGGRQVHSWGEAKAWWGAQGSPRRPLGAALLDSLIFSALSRRRALTNLES